MDIPIKSNCFDLSPSTILLDKALCILDYDLDSAERLNIKSRHIGSNIFDISSELYLARSDLESLIHSKQQPSAKILSTDDGTVLLAQYHTLTQTKQYSIISITALSSLNQYIDKLKQLTEVNTHKLREFAYSVSHDIQAPVRHIIAYIDLLNRRHAKLGTSESQDYLNLIDQAAQHTRQLIDALLDYSRIITHGKPFKPTDMDDVLIKALEGLHPLIQEHAVSINYSELPTLSVDKKQLIRVFSNLISNAIYFNDKSKTNIEICAQKNLDHWVFCISDNSMGIANDILEKIFLIFKRCHKNEQHKGLGTGLAICKQIIERHGGNIWAQSEHKRGSQFFFTLPINQAE